MAIFDTDVLSEYLDGTGNAGGPLVTSFNVSSRSDLRLYESDNNATMIKLRDSGAGFFGTCATLLQRMIETVPRNVVLSDIVSPLTIKPINATLDFDLQGRLIFTGSIRVGLFLHSDETNSNTRRFLHHLPRRLLAPSRLPRQEVRRL